MLMPLQDECFQIALWRFSEWQPSLFAVEQLSELFSASLTTLFIQEFL